VDEPGTPAVDRFEIVQIEAFDQIAELVVSQGKEEFGIGGGQRGA
jgi:hypothetical protein